MEGLILTHGLPFDAAFEFVEAPFIVAVESAGGHQIEGLYASVAELADFEPVDVVDGATSVWDAAGRLLTFRAAPASVRRSQFDHAAGEPRAEIASDPAPDAVLELLVAHLIEAVGGAAPDATRGSSLRDLLRFAESRRLVRATMQGRSDAR